MNTDDNMDTPPAEPTAKPPAKGKKKADPAAELQAKCDEYLAGWQRARADYENLQREAARRIGDTIKHANEEFLLELLPMVDYFTYAFKGIPEEDRGSSWLTGIEHIQTNFMRILEARGISLIPTVGKPFNPELHEAVEEVAGGDSGTIAEELAAGFRLNDKVIRHAKVKVYQ